MKLEPEKIQDRPGFAYYGMTEESLYRYLPCASSPCLQGKECITGPIDGLYSCQCPLENIGLKFTDDKCTVDVQQINKGIMKERVSLTKVTGKPLNFYEGEKLCSLVNATMASYDQLYVAWGAGLNVCMHGWISDGRLAFPMQSANPACGNQAGIIATLPKDKDNTRTHVWCYYNTSE
ncbi:lymphatic vessel endothelial hyaluronic acid receptor 1-like [Oculina patagonica]